MTANLRYALTLVPLALGILAYHLLRRAGEAEHPRVPPILTVSPTAIDMGIQRVGSVVAFEAELVNSGSTLLTLDPPIAPCDCIDLDLGGLSLGPGESRLVRGRRRVSAPGPSSLRIDFVAVGDSAATSLLLVVEGAQGPYMPTTAWAIGRGTLESEFPVRVVVADWPAGVQPDPVIVDGDFSGLLASRQLMDHPGAIAFEGKIVARSGQVFGVLDAFVSIPNPVHEGSLHCRLLAELVPRNGDLRKWPSCRVAFRPPAKTMIVPDIHLQSVRCLSPHDAPYRVLLRIEGPDTHVEITLADGQSISEESCDFALVNDDVEVRIRVLGHVSR